jgi:hypothetical protein
VKYGSVPEYGGPLRRRLDRSLAAVILGAMIGECMLLWGVFPVAWLWVGSQVEYRAHSTFLGLGVAFIGLLVTALVALVVMHGLDRMWVLVRRAGGVDQHEGMMVRVFFACTIIAAAAYLYWWVVVGGGPGPQVAPRA